jgi:hypothetical protein
MYIKTTFRYLLSPIRMAIIKKTKWKIIFWQGCRERKHLYPVSKNVSYFSHCRNKYGGSSKTESRSPYNLDVLVLYIYTKNNIIPQRFQKTHDYCAVFIIAKIWNQSTDKQIKKVGYAYRKNIIHLWRRIKFKCDILSSIPSTAKKFTKLCHWWENGWNWVSSY